MSYTKSDVLLANRRAGGGPLSGCGTGMKILLGLLGILLVGGVIAGVAVPLFISTKIFQDSTSTTTIGKLKYVRFDIFLR
jgi:hypothetical protein